MAFDINYLGKVSSSGNEQALGVYSYNATSTGTNEAIATVVASGYFNSYQQNLTSGSEAGPLQVGDVIHVHGNDANGMYVVTSITTNVTVGAYAAAGSIDTANLVNGAVTNAKVNAAAAIAFSKLAALTSAHFLVGNGSNVATDVAMSGDATLANTGAVTLGAVVNAAKAASYTPEAVIGGMPVLHVFNMAGGATATRTIAVAQNFTVVEAWVVNKAAGSASDTITIKNNAGTAISNAIDINVADKTVTRIGTIDDAQRVVAAGGNLQVTETDGGGNDSPACDVYVLGYVNA